MEEEKESERAAVVVVVRRKVERELKVDELGLALKWGLVCCCPWLNCLE